MTFAAFCTSRNRYEVETGLTMSDLGEKRKLTMREREVETIRQVTDDDWPDDTYFIKISIPEHCFERYCPDDEAYLLGVSRRGVRVLCHDCDIYVVSEDPKFDEMTARVSNFITKAANDIFGQYTVVGCWAM